MSVGSYSLLALFLAFPLLWMFATSLKSTSAFISDAYPLSWRSFLPAHATLQNFTQLFSVYDFGRNIANTVIVSIGQVGGSLILCPLAGYAFARLYIPFRRLLFVVCLLPAFVPIEVVVVPLYTVMKALGLLSTYPALFLPFVVSPFGIFLMRQSFLEIPGEVFEAAEMDGASAWRSFRSVGLPNVVPALATLVLISFIWSWSNFFWPLIAMQKPSGQVAQVAMGNLVSNPECPRIRGDVCRGCGGHRPACDFGHCPTALLRAGPHDDGNKVSIGSMMYTTSISTDVLKARLARTLAWMASSGLKALVVYGGPRGLGSNSLTAGYARYVSGWMSAPCPRLWSSPRTWPLPF